MMMRDQEDDQQIRVFYEMCSMIIHVLRSPPFPNPLGSSLSLSSRAPHVSSPSAFASLFLGISLSLMLFGALTFLIGLLLMHWVVGLVLLFYFAGVFSNLSEFGRSILFPATSSPEELPGKNLTLHLNGVI
ncbi:hypothetical protein U1Q18_012594 [Sarracenia purpurea var. burkii]